MECSAYYRCAPWGHFTLRSKLLSYVIIDKIHIWNVVIWLVFTSHLTKYVHITAISIHHALQHWRYMEIASLPKPQKWCTENPYRNDELPKKNIPGFLFGVVVVYNACRSCKHITEVTDRYGSHTNTNVICKDRDILMLDMKQTELLEQ